MNRLRWPATAASSALAGLTTWLALWSWMGFVEKPSGYLVPALVGCLIVATSGMLLRSARLPSLVVALVQTVLLVVWMNRLWAAEPMLGGWLPTPESMNRLGLRIQEATEVSQAFAAPVPESAPEIYPLLVVAAVVTAVLVDFLACGLRRVPLAGLPLLAVYTAPLSITDSGVPWWAFVAGAVSFLFLLASDEARRLSGWGRQLSEHNAVFDSLRTRVSATSVRASARKIGFTATGLAVVVPILVPTFGSGLFDGQGPGSGDGGDAVAISNPIVDLQRDLTRGDDVDLVRVTTTDIDPTYLRISVLDLFDGSTWKPSGRDIPIAQRAGGPLPQPPGLAPRTPRSRVSYSIEATEDFESRWLPTPYPASSIEIGGDWRYDVSTLDLVSAADGQTTAGLSYSLDALEVRPTPDSLISAEPVAEALFTRFTALPAEVPESVRARARRITDAVPSRFEKAVRLQEWFRGDGGFRYSLERAPGNGIKQLTEFLGRGPDSRVGYCEQFAAAMALMGRSLGIPSRVAVGFLRPVRVSDNTYVYSAHDLHAWPEMYFEGSGWITFEPTPANRATATPAYTTLGGDGGNGNPAAEPQNPRGPDSRFERQLAGAGAQAQQGTDRATGTERSPFLWWVLLGLVMVAAIAPRLARTVLRRRRWGRASTAGELAEAAWAELRDSALDLRIPWDDTVTLRSRARALVDSFGDPDATVEERLAGTAATGPDANPAATAALERLVRFVERARYARSVQTPTEDVTADVERCVQALRDRVTNQRKWLATWLPRSLTGTLGGELQRLARPHVAEANVAEPGVDHAV